MLIKRLVFSFSLVLALTSFALSDYRSLEARLSKVRSSQEAARIILDDPVGDKDEQLSKLAVAASKSPPSLDTLERLTDSIALRAKVEGLSKGPDNSAAIQGIKKSPLYRDPSVKSQSNWLKDAMENFGKLFNGFKPIDTPKTKGPDLGGLAFLGPLLMYTMYVLLAAGLLAFAVYAARYFSFSRRLKRKASAMLEEDEPERTLDEWLAMADRLEAEGQYREAVRCLYLACLLKFDEAGVARFHRGETNWEHLKRISTSPRYPAGLDFLSPTKRFDLVWYGLRGKGQPDVDDFRGWYVEVSASLVGVKAA